MPNTSTTSTPAAENEGPPQDHILPPPIGSQRPPEMESQDDGTDAVRHRIQVLTKDELKDLLKARDLAGSGINKCNKDGEY